MAANVESKYILINYSWLKFVRFCFIMNVNLRSEKSNYDLELLHIAKKQLCKVEISDITAYTMKVVMYILLLDLA